MPRLVVLLFICSFLCPCSFALQIFKATKCQSGYFQCNDGKCIQNNERCNGWTDCEDGSDEQNCEFKSDIYDYDSYNELKSIENEEPTHSHSAIICNNNEYKCKNNECIPKKKFCDREWDCKDGSDEYGDCVHDLQCDNRFRCVNDQHCIFHKWVCDGSEDCSDGSDEWNCSANKTSSASNCKTEKSQFWCKNQRCIALDAVCNKKDDCGDGSDEGAGCTSSSCKSAGCNHKCNQTPTGSVCTCKPGYELQKDSRTCKDIDECQTYGICDQKCMNSPGSYSCDCHKEYYLLEDKKTCKARAGEATIAFSTKSEIMWMYADSKISFPFALHLNRAVGVAMNGHDHVYWSDIEENGETLVKRTPFSKHEVIVTTGLSMISDIAVDWVTENLYFADEGYKRIGVCNDNGTICTVLMKILKPSSIALLPNRGKMYWSDGGFNTISVAGMDGKNISPFVSKNLGWPKSLTIDYSSDRLYWIDLKSHIVESIRLDGTDRRVVLSDLIDVPFSLAVFENKLYWSDWGANMIQSCNKFSGKDWHILYRTHNKPYHIHIDHSAIKPKINNPCKSNPCSQLCMLNQVQGYTCACTLDKELNTDNRTCQEMKEKQHLLIFAGNVFINYYYGMLGKPKEIGVSSPLNVEDIISDLLSGQVIIRKRVWLGSDIVRYDPVSNTFENLIKTYLSLGGVAFDHIGNNLYLSNIRTRSIEVRNVKTKAMTAFYFQDLVPYSITLVPEESKMFVAFRQYINNFWFLENSNYDTFSIYEMRMDGLGERRKLRENLKGPKILMYYDRNSKTLLVSDQGSGVILSHSHNGTRVLRTGLKEPRSLTVAGNNIFWTEVNSNKLYWTDFKISFNHKAIAFHIPKHPGTPFVVTLHKDAKQDHACQKNNGNCSHVCLLSFNTLFICACPPGMELSSNNRTCVSQHKCPKDEYKCSEHNLCIKKEQLCDGTSDCPNGEDETADCEEKGKRCKEDQFMCENGECISSKDRCNSNFDCTDQSDEKNCEKPKCNSDEFQCHDGTCIPNSKVCNDYPDCHDYSDESFTSCKSLTCAPNYFMCNDHLCIPNIFVCNGNNDCQDGEDEAPERCKRDANASNVTQCQSEDFKCTNGNCISSSLKCDGIDDCHDGSDEKYCLRKAHVVNCTANEYHCLNTDICLPKNLRCNGVRDCPKHDDEYNCAYCFEDEFACDNRKCIPENWVCDKTDDCGDNSDEENCDGSKKIINESGECYEFKCSVGTCLPYSKVCDGIRDCPDGSDENGKCQIACTVNNFCKGVCYKTPTGAICGCQHGYRLAADGITCEDINECENDLCSQICRNTIGSYECSCHDGYYIHRDKVSCKAVGPIMYFITATKNDIRMISSNLHSTEVIHSLSDSSVSGLDVNTLQGSIYWSNDELGTIERFNFKTKNITTITTVEHPQALTVDWITDNVYVIDNDRPNTIKVCNFEQERCATLVKIEDKAKAKSLVVDPINKWLFWTQITWHTVQTSETQQFSKICRTDMTGVDMKIISLNAGVVTGMAIDHIKSKLYWSNSYLRTIESSNLDGSQHSTFLNTDMHHPSGISIYEQSLYWYMGSNGQMQICKTFGEKSCKTLNLGTNNIHRHFAILHISRQPAGKNPCEEKYCNYMCVQKDNATCICSNGKPIESNSTCTINMNELKFGTKSMNLLKNTRHMSSVYSVTLIVLLVSVLLLCVYYYYQKNRLKWKSAKDFSCSSIHFQNPSYDRRDEVEMTLESETSDLAPGEHEYVNPINCKLLKTAMECSVQRSEQCSEKNDVEETEEENKALIYFTNMK